MKMMRALFPLLAALVLAALATDLTLNSDAVVPEQQLAETPSKRAKIAKEIITDVKKLAGVPAVAAKTKPSKSGRTNCFLIGSKKRPRGAKTLKGKGAKKAETTMRMIKMAASSRFPCHKACDSPKDLIKTLKFRQIRGAQSKKTHRKKPAGYRICVGQAPKPKRMAQTHCKLLSVYCKKVKELQMMALGDDAQASVSRGPGGAFLSTTGSFTLSSGGGPMARRLVAPVDIEELDLSQWSAHTSLNHNLNLNQQDN